MPPVPLPMQVKGTQNLRTLAAAIKESGSKELRGELYKGLNGVAKPLRVEAQQSALKRLPRRGGLASRVAQSKFSARRMVKGDQVGVRLVGSSRLDLRSLDRGRLRWPVYPRGPRSEWRWKERRIRPGWWTDALEGKAGADAHRAVQDVAKNLKRKLEAAAR
jgi:hypothetical protein